MKRQTTAIAALAAALCLTAQVKPGIEVMRDGGFKELQGKRVGLITNPTGVDNDLRSTIDILHAAPGVTLAALFSPEHGVRGDVYAGDRVDAATDAATGVPSYSIYGKVLRPTPEMLDKVDAVVYDIQDNGCRSFTFISTMGRAMEAAADEGKEFIVLDRPNPVGGDIVEGCLVEDSCRSFVSQFAIPYLYGLTPGELAMYLNDTELAAKGKKAKLTVVPMEGYRRSMTFEQTGMPWVLPSPHMPTAETSLLYPASGIVGELNYLNIGVGYTAPFKLFGAPWIDARELAAALDSLALPGVKWRPVHYKPFYSMFKGENIQGVELFVTDAAKAPLSLINFYVMQELARLYPDHKAMETADKSRFSMFDKVVGSKEIRRRFARRHRVEDIIDFWNKDGEAFREAAAKYRLYE